MAQPFQSNPLTSNYQRQLKKITAGCGESVTATEIALNNVRALIQTGGDMWWDFKNAQYEIPKGSGKTALWNGGIWVGTVFGKICQQGSDSVCDRYV